MSAAVTIEGNAFSLDRFTDGDYVNLPYHVIAGDRPGSGTLHFTVGNIRAVLPIIVH